MVHSGGLIDLPWGCNANGVCHYTVTVKPWQKRVGPATAKLITDNLKAVLQRLFPASGCWTFDSSDLAGSVPVMANVGKVMFLLALRYIQRSTGSLALAYSYSAIRLRGRLAGCVGGATDSDVLGETWTLPLGVFWPSGRQLI